MKSDKGNTVLFIIIILALIILVLFDAYILFKKGQFSIPSQTQTPVNSTKRQGDSVDLSTKPDAKFLQDYITHCNNTANYHWSGNDCVSQ